MDLYTFFIAAAVGAVLWVSYRILKRRRIDRRFGGRISGGRSGTLLFSCGDRIGKAEYEVGSTVDYIVYSSSIGWENEKSPTVEEQKTIIGALRTWMLARGSSMEVANDAQQGAPPDAPALHAGVPSLTSFGRRR
jgi:hypothetical protein